MPTFEMKPGTEVPSPEEAAKIEAGIASDPDAFELDEEWFDRARPAAEVLPRLVEQYKRTRGPQKSPTKDFISIRLDADVTEHFRATGKGWQTRLNDALRKAVFGE